MVPFERALVTSYRPSIVTIHIFTRFRDIAAFVFQNTTFSHPTSNLPKISPCSPGIRRMTFGLRRAKVFGLLSIQLISKISNLCGPDPPTLQTDGRSDRRTDGRTTFKSQYRALRQSASRGENNSVMLNDVSSRPTYKRYAGLSQNKTNIYHKEINASL